LHINVEDLLSLLFCLAHSQFGTLCIQRSQSIAQSILDLKKEKLRKRLSERETEKERENCGEFNSPQSSLFVA